jgi:D-alanine-D-alanine ligase
MRVAVLMGGTSEERPVSLVSGAEVAAALRGRGHEVVAVDPASGVLSRERERELRESGVAREAPPSAGPGERDPLLLLDQALRACAPDVVFVALHGGAGEDGTVQSLLDLIGIPYAGSGHTGCALAMDKDLTKRLLRDAGIASARFNTVRQPLSDAGAERICAGLGLPLFVKPANLGSSVGVSKVAVCRDLPAAVATALRHDRKVLVEECIDGRELEVSVLGNDRRAASLAGEVVTSRGHEFYSYAAKYLDAEGAALLIPAPLTAGEQQRARELACRVCAVLEVEGMARVDFFLRPAAPPHRQSEFLVNEVNTIPGFTEISMYAKLWEASGVPFPELLRRLLHLALERHRGPGR